MSLEELKAALCAHIAAFAGMGEVKVISEFPTSAMLLPLRAPLLSVGFRGVEFRPMMGGEGRCRICLRLDLYAPVLAKENACHKIFDALCSGMMGDRSLGCEKIWCEEITHRQDAGCFLLPISAEMELVTLPRDENAAEIKDFIIRSDVK